MAEVYDLSTALELDWYENIGLCKPGEAERLINDGDTTLGGRIPGQPEWGPGVLWRGCGPPRQSPRYANSCGNSVAEAKGRQVENAKAGITANQGLFGHGSSVIVVK